MDVIAGMRTFCAVVAEGSFVKGARKLELSPALASKYVGQLEERLGVRLLNRTTRSLALTEAGQSYYRRCAELLDEFDVLEAVIQDKQAQPAGHLRISAPVSFGETHLSHAFAAFLRENPEISIETRLTDRFVRIVDEGFDMAIRIGALEDSSLIARKLATIPIAIYASPDYLQRRGTPQMPQDLSKHDCVIDSNYKGGANWQLRGEEGIVTVPVQGRYISDNAASCREIVAKGLGIGSGPRFVVEEDLQSGRLVEVLPEFLQQPTSLYAVFPHSRYLPTKIKACIESLSRYFAANHNSRFD